MDLEIGSCAGSDMSPIFLRIDPEPQLVVLLLILMLVATECGYHLGR